MRVGVSLLTLFPGRVGGSDTYVRGLLDEFGRGHGPAQVAVLANRHVVAAYAGGGPVDVRLVRSYPAGDSIPTRAIGMAYARARPSRVARGVPDGLDVLHLAVTVPIPRLPVPTVVTVHDVSHLDRRGAAAALARGYRRWAYDGAARQADGVIVASEFARDRLVECAGVDPARTHVIGLGVDAGIFHPAPAPEDERVLARFSLPERFVVYPANLWPHKNHGRLLEALSLAADRDVHLVLAGQRYGRWPRLRTRARALGVHRRVHHLGHVDPRAVAALMRRSRGLVFPSLDESFGAPALEAMACGCPVAVAGRTALPEVHGGAALQFDPRDPRAIASAIDRLLDDGDLRDELGAAGLERASERGWRECAARHLDVYSTVAAAG